MKIKDKNNFLSNDQFDNSEYINFLDMLSTKFNDPGRVDTIREDEPLNVNGSNIAILLKVNSSILAIIYTLPITGTLTLLQR